MTERPLALITGTSRDVGEYTALGLAMAGWDILGVYRNPQHDQDQAEIIERAARGYRVDMTALRADLADPGTVDLLVNHGRQVFGERKYQALILSAAGGFDRSLEEARIINVDAQLRLVDAFLPHLSEGAVIVYLTSDPAHRFRMLEKPQRELGAYSSVAVTKSVTEQILRSRIPEFSAKGIRLATVVGNVLEGTFVSRVLRGRYRNLVQQMEIEVEDGIFPTAMEMASAVVRVVRGNYPTGYTEYVGVKPAYQLYPSNPQGLYLVGAPPMKEGSVLSREQIEEILPHRWPFMFIGGVEVIEFGNRAVGSLVDLTHPDINWTEGHFPGHPLVPGAITLEALAQLGALTVLGVPKYKGRIAYLTGVYGMKLRDTITPAENVHLEVNGMRLREMGGMVFGKGSVRAVNSAGRPVVEGKLSFAVSSLNA